MTRLIIPVEPGLELRQYVKDDAPAIFALIDRNRAHLSQHGDITAKKYDTLESVRDSIVPPEHAVRIRMGGWRGDTFVGTVNITPIGDYGTAEIGGLLGEIFQGTGLATKAARAIENWAFNYTNIRKLFAKIQYGNTRSMQVVERLGYSLAGIDKDNTWYFIRSKEACKVERKLL